MHVSDGDSCPVEGTCRYLSLHHAVDIVLDTWPYAGGTTSNHALWMGVPVVSLRGPSRAHCQGAALMGRMRLEDWVADDVEGFVRIAIEKAHEPGDLADLRMGMRERWRASPWRDARVVARGLETALRIMWQRWCAGLPAAHFDVPASAVMPVPVDACTDREIFPHTGAHPCRPSAISHQRLPHPHRSA